jgi:hypothetical protein
MPRQEARRSTKKRGGIFSKFFRRDFSMAHFSLSPMDVSHGHCFGSEIVNFSPDD